MSKMTHPTHARAVLLTICLSLLTGLALAAFAGVAAQSASAQSPPICEEYPDLPECDDPTGGGGNNPPGGGGNGNGVQGPTGESGGNLPFTGYPVTPIILIAVLLLVAALTIRTYLAVRGRFTDS